MFDGQTNTILNVYYTLCVYMGSDALHYFMYNICIDCFATGNSALPGYIGYITKELCLEGNNTAGFNQNMYHMQLHNIGFSCVPN